MYCYLWAVSQFIPNPVRCYKCQKFGHTKFNCRKNEVAINVGKRITLTPRNVKMNQNVLIAKVSMHQMIKNFQNGKKRKKYRESRLKEEFPTQKPRDKWTYLIQ